MRREMATAASTALVLTLAPCAAPAQSLVDLARQERARRAGIAPEARSKVYTNDDLRNSGGLTIGAAPGTAEPETDAGSGRAGRASGAEGEEHGTQAEDGEVLDESGWRARMTAAQEARERAALVASALRNRADGLWAQFTAMDDPARRRVVERQRTEALAELEHTQAEADRLEREIGDIREEARRAGVPPGWLRR